MEGGGRLTIYVRQNIFSRKMHFIARYFQLIFLSLPHSNFQEKIIMNLSLNNITLCTSCINNLQEKQLFVKPGGGGGIPL
jgi:hypothetical protein